jgi:hypothetical protein
MRFVRDQNVSSSIVGLNKVVNEKKGGVVPLIVEVFDSTIQDILIYSAIEINETETVSIISVANPYHQNVITKDMIYSQ